jgi:hypothetical protein
MSAIVCVPHACAGSGPDPGVCALCHAEKAALASLEGGHAPFLDCITCHEERRPGTFGHGHRKVPTSCTTHHTVQVETHPPPAKKLGAANLQRSCLKCHDPHGSTNAHLVRTDIRTGGRLHPVDFPKTAEGQPTSFVDPASPGKGLCEICHHTTRFYTASGNGQPHFMDDCTLCHNHAAGFQVVITDASCPICHSTEANLLAKENLHHDRFAGSCSSCHAAVSPNPGPGHRATSACVDCHSETLVATHVPPGLTIPCAQCHEPHGTDNIRLIRDVIHTVQGDDRPVRFDNLAGRADGSFASASAPGTGLCEVCHTSTRFYRADGSAAPHYTTTCLQCHPHAAGFSPR